MGAVTAKKVIAEYAETPPHPDRICRCDPTPPRLLLLDRRDALVAGREAELVEPFGEEIAEHRLAQ